MRQTFCLSTSLLAALLVGVLSACSTSKAVVYQDEDFSSTSTYSHNFPASEAQTCEAARRALLSQGYVIYQAKTELVNGRKNFQPDSATHVQIDFHVVCASDGKGGQSTIAFVNALQDRYALKKNNNSASLGVGALGSISLPFGSSDDSLVKVASETIREGDFYSRFFGLVERYLSVDSGPPEEEIKATAASAAPNPSAQKD